MFVTIPIIAYSRTVALGDLLPMSAQVLLIHNDRTTRQALAAALRVLHYAPHEAESLAGVRHQFRQRTYDLVIVDERTPSGLEADWLQTVVDLAGQTPVLVLTGQPAPVPPAATDTLTYLLKPISLTTLIGVVEQLLSPHRLPLPNNILPAA